jgi:hypothetical protein
MRVTVINYCGTVGKTTVASHLLAPRITDAGIYAVETVNETAADLGLEVEQTRAERFGDLYKRLMIAEGNAIVDVGASNAEEFIERMIKFHGSHLEFDYFVVPVTSGAKEQKETIKTLQALAAVGVTRDRIRVLFNRVANDVVAEFPAVLGFAKKSSSFVANPEAAIHENEVFDLLTTKRMTIASVLADGTDYRALLRTMNQEKEPSKVSHCADMHVIQALARGVSQQLDGTFRALFA